MKKLLVLILLFSFFVATPVFLSGVSAKTKAPVKKVVVKKTAPKVAPKKVLKGAKFIPYVFTSFSSLINCSMPDGKTIKAKKADCDAVTAFWNKNRPSSPSNNSGGGGNNNNNNGGSNNNSNNGNNNNPPVIGTPAVTSVTVMPCTSSSCHGITTIKVQGTGFTAATRLELIGSGVTGSYMGGDYSTYLLTDFINLPKGTYSARIYSYNGDIHEVTVVLAVTIN